MYTNLELQKACAMLRGEIKRLKVEVEAQKKKEGAGGGMEQEEEEEDDDDL